jgi:type IV pilus assembly protein PilY1
MKKVVILLIMISLCVSLYAWDDEELFYNSVKPNILFLLDSSGSMRNVIFHPNYVPGTGTGSFANAPDSMYRDWARTKYLARWVNGTNAYTSPPGNIGVCGCFQRVAVGANYRYRIGSNGSNFAVDDRVLLFSPNRSESEGWANIINVQTIGGNLWITLDNVHGGELDNNGNELGRFVAGGWNRTRFVVSRNATHTPMAVKFWGGIDKMDTTDTASYRFNGTNDTDDYFEWVFNNASAQDRTEISHFADYGTFDTSVTTVQQNSYTRIQVAREALLGITNHADFQDKVRLGLMEFNGTNGGYLASFGGNYGVIRDIEDTADKNELLDIIDHMRGAGGTPLGEALAETWNYFAGNSPYYSSRTGNGGSTYDSPCDLYCRKNFVIVLSDGEPNADNNFFSVPGGSIHTVFDSEPSGWSGPDWDVVNVAEYIYNNDSRTDLNETQNINVYTIGFTTSGETNTLLTSAAERGGGEFFQANDYGSLVNQFASILGKIMEKITSFSAFAAPKHSLTHGKRGYIATFIPRSNKARWEGFLKAFNLSDQGDFEIDIDGNATNAIWDARELLDSRSYNGTGGGFGTMAGTGDRTIFTWLDGSEEMFVDSNTDLTHEMLNLVAGEDEDRTKIIEVVRGKANPYEYESKLGDVFHFDPKISTAPWKLLSYIYPSFTPFHEQYKNRDEVLFVGGNDGMFHCFDVGNGNELWSFIPPSCLNKLDKIGFNKDHDYFIDGQATVKNVQVANSGNYYDWQTIIVFGQGLGGESYYNLNITDPREPRVKWQIGTSTLPNADLGKTIISNRSSSTIVSNYKLLGKTMALPSIGAIKYKNGSSDVLTAYSVVVVSGGYDTEELTPVSTGGNRQGKSLFVLDADTGEIVKSFVYGGSSNSTTSWSSPDFLFSMSCEPVLVDYNNDSFYDAIYQADIGGRIWKIDISSSDRTNWIPFIIFDTEGSITEGKSSQPFFIAPTIGYDGEYNIWVFAGTGYRANPNDQSNTGQFYAFMDTVNQGDNPLTPDDLGDISSILEGNSSNVDSDMDGYTDAQEVAEGTDPNDPNDYPAGQAPSGGINVSNAKGFYFNFFNSTYSGEKMFAPAPIYIGGYLIFNTYVPPNNDGSTANDDETCDPAGDLFVYLFKLDVTDGVISLESPNVSKGRILGSGLLSGDKYKIYIGDGEIGSKKITAQQPLGIKNSYGIMFFRENKTKVFHD